MVKYGSKIIGTGICVDKTPIENSEFEDRIFIDAEGENYKDDAGIVKSTKTILNELTNVTGIERRRYSPDMLTSELGTKATLDGLNSSKKTPSDLDLIIFAHNFGDVTELGKSYDFVSSFASKIKKGLGISDPEILAYDIIPGQTWNQNLLKEIPGKKILVIYGGDETSYSERIFRDAKAKYDDSIEKDKIGAIVYIHNGIECLAEKTGKNLGANNPKLVTFDLLFGCPGWLESMIHADYLLKTHGFKLGSIIGAERLSKVIDIFDRDGPIYSDGGGMTLIERVGFDESAGIISSVSKSFSDYEPLLKMGPSYNAQWGNGRQFLKMDGSALYKAVIEEIPKVMKECIDKSGLSYEDVFKFVMHQANNNMDEKTLMRTFDLYGVKRREFKEKDIGGLRMPMTIRDLANNSVATQVIMLHFLINGNAKEYGVGLGDHRINRGDVINLTSMGAGVNGNSALLKY